VQETERRKSDLRQLFCPGLLDRRCHTRKHLDIDVRGAGPQQATGGGSAAGAESQDVVDQDDALAPDRRALACGMAKAPWRLRARSLRLRPT
jgi:hypothetical protein